LKRRWTRPALADLVEAQNYIERDNPAAAEAAAQRVWDAAKKLCDNPESGRQGHIQGTREWPVSQTQYLIVYRVKKDAVEILRVWHGRRNWQNNPTG
jgi:addiction module RelE/StbE family toxin